jgi:molecular chaperone GrpE
MTERNVSPEPDGAGQAPETQAVLEDLESLRTRIQETERERDQFLELLQRTRADFENYQKRNQRDLLQERRYSASPLALELLPALDNLERAVAAAKQGGENASLLQGVRMVLSQLLDALKRQGITRMDPLHQPFDPAHHQAVTQQPSADHPAGTVLQVLQPGYLIHDRVLRPASVIVAAAPAENS